VRVACSDGGELERRFVTSLPPSAPIGVVLVSPLRVLIHARRWARRAQTSAMPCRDRRLVIAGTDFAGREP
jgi:hypothetical protein